MINRCSRRAVPGNCSPETILLEPTDLIEHVTKPIPMKWQPQKPNTEPIFILPKNTNSKPNFNIERSQNADKILIKYQEIWDRKTKYRFGFGIFLVYQIFGY